MRKPSDFPELSLDEVFTRDAIEYRRSIREEFLARGREEGHENGVLEGLEVGRTSGRLEMARDALQIVAERRFGRLSERFCIVIRFMTDLQPLLRGLQEVAVAKDLEELMDRICCRPPDRKDAE